MAASDIVLVLGAVGVLVTALAAAWVSLRKNVQEVHKIVNQQRTDMLKYQNDLKRALKEAGVNIPEDESLDHTPPV